MYVRVPKLVYSVSGNAFHDGFTNSFRRNPLFSPMTTKGPKSVPHTHYCNKCGVSTVLTKTPITPKLCADGSTHHIVPIESAAGITPLNHNTMYIYL